MVVVETASRPRKRLGDFLKEKKHVTEGVHFVNKHICFREFRFQFVGNLNVRNEFYGANDFGLESRVAGHQSSKHLRVIIEHSGASVGIKCT